MFFSAYPPGQGQLVFGVNGVLNVYARWYNGVDFVDFAEYKVTRQRPESVVLTHTPYDRMYSLFSQ